MKRQSAVLWTAYTALFLFFTLFFLLFNYPSERLTAQVNGWVLGATGGALTVSEVQYRPPLSLAAESVALNTGKVWVDLGQVVINPRLLGVLTGKKGADVRLENQWMEMGLSFITSGESLDLDVKGVDLDLSKLPEDLVNLPVNLTGRVNVSGDILTPDLSSGVVSEGGVVVTSGPVQISADLLETLGFSPLKISSISAVATIKDNVLTLGENALEGDLNASARGTVRIAPGNLDSSRLDLTVEITPGAGNRERLTPVFSIMGARPRADGSVSVRVRGTVGRPSVTM